MTDTSRGDNPPRPPRRTARGTPAFPRDGEFATLEEIHAAALAHLSPEASVYLESGAGTEQTLRANREAFSRWVIKPRPMSGVSDPATRTEVKAAGYQALCVTLDCPIVGFRARSRMARFHPDPAIWHGNVVHDGSPNVAFNYAAQGAPAWTWDQLAEATARHGLPWIAKGILTAEAAEAALNAGASAILVSNHGGRQVDPAPATLDVLPEIAVQVSGRVPLLLDSGVRTGADVFLALALGASAVVIGRLAAYGLAAASEYGVQRTLELLTEELHILMTLSGIPDIASITPDTVARR